MADGNLLMNMGQQNPYREALLARMQPREQPQLMPSGYESGVGGAAFLLDQFFGGVRERRMQGWLEKEAEKEKGRSQYFQAVQIALANPDLTPEGRTAVLQNFQQVAGRSMQSELGDTKAKKAEGVGGNVRNIFQNIAVGMSGGPLPKGEDPIDQRHLLDLLSISGPQYSVAAQVTQYGKRIDDILATLRQQRPYATQAEVSAVVGPIVAEMQAKGLPVPDNARMALQAARPMESPLLEGSYEWLQQQQRLLPAPSAPPTVVAPAPVTIAPGVGAPTPQPAAAAPGAAPAPAPRFPPLPPELLGDPLPRGAMMHLRNLKLAGNPERVLVNGTYTTEATRVPEGVAGVPGGYYHEQTGRRLLGDVVTGVPIPTATAARAERIQLRDIYEDKQGRPSTRAHTWRINLDTNEREYVGPGRAPTPRPESAAMKRLEREDKILDASTKVLTETFGGGGTLQNARENAEKFYSKDPVVAPYLASVIRQLDELLRLERASGKSMDLYASLDRARQMAQENRARLQPQVSRDIAVQQAADLESLLIGSTPEPSATPQEPEDEYVPKM